MIEDYLRELRASLRTRPEETERILAEAEDHLAQTVAAGRAAGLTEIEAHEAAISAFGSVSVVVRAHTTHRVRLRAIAADLPMAAWKLAWLGLLGSGAMRLLMAAMLHWTRTVTSHVPGTPSGYIVSHPPVSPVLLFQGGGMLALGLGLAAGYRLVRTRRPAPLGGFFPLAAAVFYLVTIPVGLTAVAAVNGGVVNVGQQGTATVLAMAGLAVLYSARMAGMLIFQRMLTWQGRTS